MDPIRVGILGADPDQGWAIRAHIPALRHLPEFRITAVGTTRTASARRAARLLDARPYTDPQLLAADPAVDLVLIAVKVPAHVELIGAALSAGKHVYCEWPLAPTTAEAEQLTSLAAAAGVRHLIGLQARYSPALLRARGLIANGAVGQPLSVTVYSARDKGAGSRIPGRLAYTLDRGAGAGMLEVAGGHTLDAVQYLIGDFTTVTAELAVRVPRYTIVETGAAVTADSPDHLALAATTADGVTVAAHLHDGKVDVGRTVIEIAGTTGDLTIRSGAGGAGGIQLGELALHRAGDADLAAAEQHSLDTEAASVARLYSALAADVRTGTRTVPDFGTALRTHRLLDAIRRSAASGSRVRVSR